MNHVRKFALVLIALGLSVSPIHSAPFFSADSAPVVVQSKPLPRQTDIPTALHPVPATHTIVPSSPAPLPVTQKPDREIAVELRGGQDVVDLGRGPVLYPIPGGFPPYIVEHDLYGGTAHFGSLTEGMTVRMTGLVSGIYTVGQIINVPNTGTTSEFKAYKTMPKVMLQTCITGTDRMIIVGLY